MPDVTIADLKPDPRNVRTHNPRNIGMIVNALHQVGAARSIVVDEDNVILAGNGVIEAATEAGIERLRIIEADGEEIIAVRRSGLTPEQKQKLAIYDNRTAELAEWDTEALADIGEDLDLGEYFTGTELGELGVDFDEPVIEDPGPQIDRAAELQEKWQTARGQVWQIGKHRLMCGDSTSAEDVGRLMGGRTPMLMVTDPPYGVELDQGWRDRRGLNRLGRAQSDHLANDDTADWARCWELSPAEVAYVWSAAGALQLTTGDALVRGGFDLRQQVVWVKTMAPLSRSAYHWKHEPCWYAVRKGCTAHWIGDRTETTVWEAASPKHIMGGSSEEKLDHPTQKPLECMARPIRNHEGDVYDPFLGSGTTMVAAEQLGRVCYGMEIEPKYVAVTLERMAGMGLEPVLTETCEGV